MDTPRDPFREFEQFVDRLIVVTPESAATVERKIDFLDRLIERWRIERHELINQVVFEEFLDCTWLVDTDSIYFGDLGNSSHQDTGTPALQLQRRLLVFLLLNHGKHQHVLDIIKAFVGKIRPDLSTRDFKKTETGVFRCFTNTRVAANKLRDYGLLKYTHEEAFKVWVLSLPGIVVAGKAAKEPGWTLPRVADPWHGLDPFILECADATKDFPTLVKTLGELCEPNTRIFETFGRVLAEAQGLLSQYWRVLQNPDLDAAARKKLSQQHLQELDCIFGYTDFIEELSSCVQIEKLLAEANAAAAKP